MNSYAQQQMIEMSGIVIPTQWDRRGNVIQVAIQSDNFEKVLVEVDPESVVMSMIDKVIHIQGIVVGEDLVGHKIVKIQHIENPDAILED